MDIRRLNFNQDILSSIYNLRLKTELFEGKRTKAVKSVDDLVCLLKYTRKSPSEEVRESFEDFVMLLSETQKSFFQTIGVNLQSKVQHEYNHEKLYRGAKPQDSNPEELEKQQTKKKAITYRGHKRLV